MAAELSARAAARIIGGLILALMVLGYEANFGLLDAVIAPPGFLVNAAPHALELGAAAVLGLVMGMMALGMAIVAYPVLRPHSQAMAQWFFALSAAGVALAALESATLMSMLSLGEAYTKADAAQQGQFQAVRAAVASSRNWAHYIHLILVGAALFVFYAALFRFALVPRLLGAFGIVATALQIATIAMPLFGHPVIFPMLAPLGICQLILALWLLAKGFRPQPG